MTLTTNVEVVKNFFGLFKQGNIPALLSELSEDIKWSTPRPNEFPWGGDRLGKYAVGHYFGELLENVEVLRYEPLRFVSQGDWVVALDYTEAIVKKIQRVISFDWAIAFLVQDGKIHQLQEYSDTHDLVTAFQP